MDLVTFGEAMVRLSPPPAERLEHAHRFAVHVGGSELNVAVGAARLGVATRWVSRLPDNPLGRLIAGRAREHGVDLGEVQWTSADRAGLYFVEVGGRTLYDRAASAMSRLTPGTIDWSRALAGVRWFHTSGITPALSESAAAATAEALAAAKAAGLTVSYDLNYRPKLWSADRARQVQEPLLAHVDVLTTNEDDPRVVFGLASRAAEDTARALQDRFGCQAVAVTVRSPLSGGRTSRSAVLCMRGTIHRAPPCEADVVDAIGAGDAFDAGLIAGMLQSRDWECAVRWGTALSALKHAVPGDFSLATRADVERVVSGATANGER